MMIQTMVRLAPEVRAKAEAAAKAEGRTLSGWIKRLVHQALRIETVDTPPGRPRKVADTEPRTPRAPLLETARRVRIAQQVDAAVAHVPPLPDRLPAGAILVIYCKEHRGRKHCATCGWHPVRGYPEGKARGGARYVLP